MAYSSFIFCSYSHGMKRTLTSLKPVRALAMSYVSLKLVQMQSLQEKYMAIKNLHSQGISFSVLL